MAARRRAPDCLTRRPPATVDVRQCDPVARFLYLAPGARALSEHASASPPPVAEGCARVVCISDTHCEHASLQLPDGDLLVHAGDVLTESGMRYVAREGGDPRRNGKGGRVVEVHDAGVALLRDFAAWLRAQPHRHKVVIAGNHDLVLQGIGAARVREILAPAQYLEHEWCAAAGLRVFGSPYARYGSHNDAFNADVDWRGVPPCDVFVTHCPAVLPARDGEGVDEDAAVMAAVRASGAKLYVSGHCHWAHGLMFPRSGGGAPPCVVASVCDHHWIMPTSKMSSAAGKRGDPCDATNGGYNMRYLPIVVDLPRAQAPDSPAVGLPSTPSFSESDMEAGGGQERPRLLFFGPPNDPQTVVRLLPALSQHFAVDHFEDAEEAEQHVRQAASDGMRYAAVLTKLGTRGNMGVDVVRAVREAEGAGAAAARVVLHSATARGRAETARWWADELGACAVVDHQTEAGILPALLGRGG